MNLSEKQYNNLKRLVDNPDSSLVIHWARQNLKDNQGGYSTPRITAIIIRSLDETISKIFAIHLEAEKSGLISDDYETFYDQLEEQVLKDLNDFVKEYINCRWIFWDSDDPHSGFEATSHRYRVLVDKEGHNLVNVPAKKRISLNSCLKEIYGSNYESSPQLNNLMMSNNNGQLKNNILSIEDEARAFKNSEYPEILESIKGKADFLIEVTRKTVNKSLVVSNKNFLHRLGNFFTHPIVIGIAWITGILGFILAITGSPF